MHKAQIRRITRKTHRYLGLVLGMQFLAWTLGGLYFSWTNIAAIRSEDLKATPTMLPIDTENASLTTLLDSLKKAKPALLFKNIQIVAILDKAYYQIQTIENSTAKTLLFDMKTLQHKPPLNEAEARKVAQKTLKNPTEIQQVTYLRTTHGHHEYREKPLPAYAITFAAPNEVTVYIATELGTVQTIRNNEWRVFDFLWMLHTMDYENRDDINNWVLRIFSILGLVTILSGFVLYALTSKFILKKA